MGKRKAVLGITGSPSTGKKSVGLLLAGLLNFKLLDLNKLAKESSLIQKDGSVDTNKLRKLVRKNINGGGVVVAGHLLPHILSKGEVDFVAVLRCSPTELEKRYFERGYSESKIKNNVSAEILDVCLADAIRIFGGDVVAEFDTTLKEAPEVTEAIAAVFTNPRSKSVGKVRWLSGSKAKNLIKLYLS